MSGKWLLGLSTSQDPGANSALLGWVLFVHCHVIAGMCLLLSLWPRRQDAGDSVEQSFDLLLCQPFFALLHHQLDLNSSHRSVIQQLKLFSFGQLVVLHCCEKFSYNLRTLVPTWCF